MVYQVVLFSSRHNLLDPVWKFQPTILGLGVVIWIITLFNANSLIILYRNTMHIPNRMECALFINRLLIWTFINPNYQDLWFNQCIYIYPSKLSIFLAFFSSWSTSSLTSVHASSGGPYKSTCSETSQTSSTTTKFFTGIRFYRGKIYETTRYFDP